VRRTSRALEQSVLRWLARNDAEICQRRRMVRGAPGHHLWAMRPGLDVAKRGLTGWQAERHVRRPLSKKARRRSRSVRCLPA
jgi:hypothetical protein